MNLIDRRLGLLFATSVLLLGFVLVRAAWLQAVQGSDYSADARSQQTEMVTVPGVRGAILDRNGRELAVSEEAASIFATPYQVDDPPAAAARLSKVLGVDQHEMAHALELRDRELGEVSEPFHGRQPGAALQTRRERLREELGARGLRDARGGGERALTQGGTTQHHRGRFAAAQGLGDDVDR